METTVVKRGQNVRIVWLILLGLISVVLYLNISQKQNNHANHAGHAEHKNVFQSGKLLSISLNEIRSIELGYSGGLYLIERDELGNWFYHAHGASDGVLQSHEHVATPEENEAIGIALIGLENARVERRLRTKLKDEYGVIRPSLITLVYAENPNQPISQYAFGDLAPDGLSRYVHLVGSEQIATIADYQYENLIGLIAKIEALNEDAQNTISQDWRDQ